MRRSVGYAETPSRATERAADETRSAAATPAVLESLREIQGDFWRFLARSEASKRARLIETERGFRDLKAPRTTPGVPPRRATHPRAHVRLCWLALLLIRVAKRCTDQSRIALELERLHLVTLTGPTGAAHHTTALTVPSA